MPRIRKGAARRQAHRRVLKLAKGHRSSAGHLYRAAKEAIVRGGVYARFGRKLRKRDFRSLWITRLTAACQQRGIMYSRLVNGSFFSKNHCVSPSKFSPAHAGYLKWGDKSRWLPGRMLAGWGSFTAPWLIKSPNRSAARPGR